MPVALEMGDAVDLFVARHPETSRVAALAQLLLQLRQTEAQQLSQAERSLGLLRSDLRAAAAGRQQLQNKLGGKERELGQLQNQVQHRSCKRNSHRGPPGHQASRMSDGLAARCRCTHWPPGSRTPGLQPSGTKP